MSEPKLNIKEETSTKKTRSPPKKAKVEQSVPKKKKLKTDVDKAAEKAQHLRFGKAELTPDELSRLSKAQKREMYAAHAARSAVHREVDQYEDENVGVQALSEGEKAAGNVRDISKSRYARKLKKKAKAQGKKDTKTARSSAQEPTAAQDAGASSTGEGGSNWLSRWKQRQEIHKSYYAAARSGTAAQTAGGKAVSNGASAARSGVEQAVEKGKTAVSTAVKGLMNAAKGNAHVLVIVGVFLLLILMVMSGFSSCGILFSGGTQVSGQTMYSAEDRDIRGAEQDYKKLEKELDKKIKRTPTDHPGYNEYQYHLDPIEHDPWQLTSYLTTLYDDYTRSEVQGKLKETFKKQYRRIGGLIAIIPKDWKYLRGDIYYADMEPHIGSEQGGTRPVVVLQNDVGNRYAPTLIVATVTSRTEKKKYQPTHVLIAHNTAFEKPSVVQLEHRSSR